MFEIVISDENEKREYVWQNSWGLTTRTIGVMVMVHGDDKGLVLPPRVASIQVIVIPVGISANHSGEEKKAIERKAEEIVSLLKSSGVKVKSDMRNNYTPGWKYNHWELKVRNMLL
jgi:prolyl-tRNA synthetase